MLVLAPQFTIDHIGIVVDALDSAVALYCRLLGVPPEDVEYHDIPSEKVRIAMLKGSTVIELLEPTEDDTGLAKFRAKRGAGVHHLCFSVPAPLQDQLDELKASGLLLLDDTPRSGAGGKVFFVHPKSCGGVLVEFVER
jgi:methylmalonyl-CoA/ethylmalonyl-CoA epimerase